MYTVWGGDIVNLPALFRIQDWMFNLIPFVNLFQKEIKMAAKEFSKIRAGILSLVLVTVFLALPGQAQAALQSGQPLPGDLVVQTLDGMDANLADLVKGKKSIIVFFNTVCRVCLKEMKWLLDTYPDLNKVFVSIDMGGADMVRAWQGRIASSINLEGETVLLDSEFTVPRQFGFSATPSSVLVDAQGLYVKGLNGFDDYGMKYINGFMKPKPKPMPKKAQ
jgi:hypothetical protein